MTTPVQATPAASAVPVTLPQTAAAAWLRFRAAPSATTASPKGTAMTPIVCGELGRLARQLTLQASPHKLTQGSLNGLEVQGWSHSGEEQQRCTQRQVRHGTSCRGGSVALWRGCVCSCYCLVPCSAISTSLSGGNNAQSGSRTWLLCVR